MDHFHEETSVRKKTFWSSLIQFTLVIAILTLSSIAFLGLVRTLYIEWRIMVLIYTFISVAAAYGCFFLRSYLLTEYDYTFTNGEIDIAKVIASNKRKHLLTIHAEHIDDLGPFVSDKFQRIISEHRKLKINRYYVNNDLKRRYFILYDEREKKNIVLFEPSNKLLALIKMYAKKSSTI